MAAYKGFTEAQKKAHIKYMQSVATIQIRTTDDRREQIKAHAESQGESVNAFIKRAIDETMERDGYHHEIIVKGKCTACGKRLCESDGLFLCAECQKKNNKE